MRPAGAPCRSCPYRRDVPAGVWSREEYAKLWLYDLPTGEQPFGLFVCHQQDGHLCAGWVGCHDMQETLAVRVGAAEGLLTEDDLDAVFDYESPVPLFASGAEAAAHGLAGVAAPDVQAVQTIRRLHRKRKRQVSSRVMDENMLSDEELRTLSDDELVGLIEARSNVKGDAAREALAILRDEIPDDEVV